MPNAYSIPEVYEMEIEAAVDAGYYSNKSEVVRDALRILFETKSQLRLAAAIELYKKERVTLGRAAELAGLNFFEFKDVLKDRGIEIISPTSTREDMERASKLIDEIRSKNRKK